MNPFSIVNILNQVKALPEFLRSRVSGGNNTPSLNRGFSREAPKPSPLAQLGQDFSRQGQTALRNIRSLSPTPQEQESLRGSSFIDRMKLATPIALRQANPIQTLLRNMRNAPPSISPLDPRREEKLAAITDPNERRDAMMRGLTMMGTSVGMTAQAVPGIASERPWHQSALEKAVNQKDWRAVINIIEQMKPNDPYRLAVEDFLQRANVNTMLGTPSTRLEDLANIAKESKSFEGFTNTIFSSGIFSKEIASPRNEIGFKSLKDFYNSVKGIINPVYK